MVDAPHLSLARGDPGGGRGRARRRALRLDARAQARHDAGRRARRARRPARGPSRRSPSRCSTARASRSCTPARRSPAGTRSPACATRSACAGRCTRAEKLVDHLGATHFVVGHTHSSYRERLQGALTLLGAQRAITVRGMEGADVLRTGRPSASDTPGPMELPETPGSLLRGDPDPQRRGRADARDRRRRRAGRRGADGRAERRPAAVRGGPLRRASAPARRSPAPRSPTAARARRSTRCWPPDVRRRGADRTLRPGGRWYRRGDDRRRVPQRLRGRAGHARPEPQDVASLLELAAIAAHASERTAAPIACWIAGAAAGDMSELLAAARRVAPGVQ